MTTGLKICGVTRAEDLAVCRELGVDAVGINLWAGSRRGLTLQQAEAMVAGEPAGGPERVGVFVQASADEVREAVQRLRLDAIQLHWEVDPGPYAAIGAPWVWVVRGTPEVETLRMPEARPVRVLLDAQVRGFGGAGVVTDWDWAARVVHRLAPLRVWLAGGIGPTNVADAIERVNPAGVDVATGAENNGSTRGEKDPQKISELLRACR